MELPIHEQMKRCELPNPYTIKKSDLGKQIDFCFGQVQRGDIGKQIRICGAKKVRIVKLEGGTLFMENSFQKAERESADAQKGICHE